MHLCECGCGQPTKQSTRSKPRRGIRRGDWLPFVAGHYVPAARGEQHPSWRGGRSIHDRATGYIRVYAPGHPESDSRGRAFEHRLIASDVLGKPLPAGACVHHVNGDPADNRPDNLVICQDADFHNLLHARARALDVCGNVNWLQCDFCREWDDPANMRPHSKSRRKAVHRSCWNQYLRERYHRRKAAA